MRKEKITVWHMNGVMNAGGTESLIMNILRHQSQAISHVLVVHSQVNEEGVYDAELDALGIKVLRLPVIGQVGIKAYTEAFNQLIISEDQPDIIHSHLNAVGAVIAKVAKKNHIDARIIHCHADIKFRGSTINTLIQESKLALMKILVNKYGNYYFAASQAAGNRLFYKNKQVTIINNAIDSERYLCTPTKILKAKNNLGVTKESFIIGGIGRIVPIKNYEVILKAIPTLVENGFQPLFVCYGRVADEHYFKQLTSLVEALGIEDYVQFKGNSQNIAEDIAAFDTFVLPSITEGLGIVAIEAQAAGKNAWYQQESQSKSTWDLI